MGRAVLIWIAVKVIVSLIYAGNPGAAIEWIHVGTNETHWATNLRVLTSADGLLRVASSFGFLWVVPIVFYKKIRSRYLKAALLILIPYFLVILLIGNVHEIRVYAEWTPVVLMACLHVVFRKSYK